MSDSLSSARWSELAWHFFITAPWPLVDFTKPEISQRVSQAVGGYWAGRLSQVPGSWQDADSMKEAQVRVGTIASGSETAAWFFDLGSVAWMMLLGRLERDGWLTTDSDALERIKDAWRRDPAEALAVAEELKAQPAFSRDTGVLLYYVPLALWQGRKASEAMRSLDRALGRATSDFLAACGITVPLTYALLHGLSGHAERGAELLSTGRVPGRQAGWRGLESPEVRYHRARLAFGGGDRDMAARLLDEALARDVDLVLRAWSDPMWLDTEKGGPMEWVKDVVNSLLVRARHMASRASDSQERSPQDRDLLRRVSIQEGVAALRAVQEHLPDAALEESAQLLAPDFSVRFERMHRLASGIPADFPLRLGPGYAPRFAPDENYEGIGDLAQVEKLLELGQFSMADIRLANIEIVFPTAVQLGAFGYLQRLINAMATATDVLLERRRPEDRARYDTLTRLLEQSVEMVDIVKAFPSDLSQGLAPQISEVWTRISKIEREWVGIETHAFGQMRLSPPEETPDLPRGQARAITLSVLDASGTPVPGVPILWRVKSGPARARQGLACIDGEWSLSLATGVAYLTVTIRGSGVDGAIEAWILGGFSPITIPYTVAS